jgi:uncharacterized membrane protein
LHAEVSHRWEPRYRWLATCLIALGIVLRLARYLSNRPLWGDEAALALKILENPVSELAGPSMGNQVAPLGFLLAEKLAIALFGDGELALRLFPLICSIAALPLFWCWTRSLLPGIASLIALLFFVINDPLVYYASEVKPYSSDLLFALCILVLAGKSLRDGDSRRVGVGLAVAGATALWFSLPAMFVCAGTGVVLFWRASTSRDRVATRNLLLVGTAWSASLLLNYVLIISKVSSTDYMNTFWRYSFMPAFPSSLDELAWFARTFLGIFIDPVGFHFPLLCAGMFAVGIYWLFGRKKYAAALVLAPILVTLIASALGRYPFPTSFQLPHLAARIAAEGPELLHPLMGRVILFTVPFWILSVAAGIGRLLTHRHLPLTLSGGLVLLLLCYHPFVSAARNVRAASEIQDARSVMAEIASQYREGDMILIQGPGDVVGHYYARREGLRSSMRTLPGDSNSVEKELARLHHDRPAGSRTWLVTVTHPRWDIDATNEHTLALLSANFDTISEIKHFRSSGTLFQSR